MSGRIFFVVNVPPIANVPIVLAPELVKFPLTFPVNGPANAVEVVVPEISNFVLGVVVPIPTLDSEPSIVITVVVTPASLTLNVMSVFGTVFEIIPPVESTVNVMSESAPTTSPPSLVIEITPVAVSLVFDLR